MSEYVTSRYISDGKKRSEKSLNYGTKRKMLIITFAPLKILPITGTSGNQLIDIPKLMFFYNLKVLSTLSTTMLAMASDEVAAGDGELRTCRILLPMSPSP